MTSLAPLNQLTSVSLSLDSIFLDPNNPRFVGPNWIYVPDANIADEAYQQNARRKLIKDFGVDKLRMNMEINGYLPIDRVVVREFTEGQYVVLEGNRRICAAKLIAEAASEGAEFPSEVMDSLREIPCLQYTGVDRDASWVFQGIRHITGISEWSSFNKAKLLVEQMEEEELTLTEVGKRFGLTPHGAGQWVRGYRAFKQAREKSDFVTEVDERVYPYFQELFSRSSAKVREWMEWNEPDHEFKNALNFNEFVGWFYPRPEVEDENAQSDRLGDWDRRVVRRQDDIRQIAFLINEAPDAFQEFRRELDLEKAYSVAVAKKYEKTAKEEFDPVAEVFSIIKECAKVLDNIPHKILRDEQQRSRLLEEIAPLEAAISVIKNE